MTFHSDYSLRHPEVVFHLPKSFIAHANPQLESGRQQALAWMKRQGISPLLRSVDAGNTHTPHDEIMTDNRQAND